MRASMAVVAVCLGLIGAVRAQGVDALSGVWHGQLPAGGVMTLVRVKLEGGGSGTWQQTPRGKPLQPNACLGKEHPLAVTETGPGTFRFHVQASKTLSGCQDGQMMLTLVEGKRLEGRFADGRTLVLER